MRTARSMFIIGLTVAFTALIAGPVGASPPGSDAEPVPIPQTFPGTPFHVLAPGPTDFGFMGENVEPAVITNFRGFTAYSVAAGSATDAAGTVYDMIIDMRLFQGEYVSADGTHHRGTFGFI